MNQVFIKYFCFAQSHLTLTLYYFFKVLINCFNTCFIQQLKKNLTEYWYSIYFTNFILTYSSLSPSYYLIFETPPLVSAEVICECCLRIFSIISFVIMSIFYSLFHFNQLYRICSPHDELLHHCMQCLVQLASISGSVFQDDASHLSYLVHYINGFLNIVGK